MTAGTAKRVSRRADDNSGATPRAENASSGRNGRNKPKHQNSRRQRNNNRISQKRRSKTQCGPPDESILSDVEDTNASPSALDTNAHNRQEPPLMTSSENVERLQNDLQIRRRRKMDVNTVCSEDGIECDVNVIRVDPSRVYQRCFSSNVGLLEDQGKMTARSEAEVIKSSLGNNGWHRALAGIPPGIRKERTSALDRRAAKRVLEKVEPLRDELEALGEEYRQLMIEINALESDRLEMERLFHEAASQYRGSDEAPSWQAFRLNMGYLPSEDLQSAPAMFLEDAPLSSPENEDYECKLDLSVQNLIRHHRGLGIALLVADPQLKKALIGRCYMNSNIGIGAATSLSQSLKRVKTATLIDEGGEWLKQCSITGCDTDDKAQTLSTSCFLVFDSGKNYLRGKLPSNLLARLFRERRVSKHLRYLSTGPSYLVGNGDKSRCYYAEFSDGEAWWGVNDDGELDGILQEVDVHRVAFGRSSSIGDKPSWVVIAKNGTCKWRNVPDGLHEALTRANESAGAACPCECSLGMGGSYFVRFLDGSIDFALPAFVADVLESLESDGKLVRAVCMHVDTYDVIIRFSADFC